MHFTQNYHCFEDKIYNKYYNMRVNELKALYENKGAIKTQIPSNLKTIILPTAETETLTTINAHHVELSLPVVQEESKKSFIKDNDFLSELNKKLLNRSTRARISQEQSSLQEYKAENIIQKQEIVVKQHQEQEHTRVFLKKESELNFDDIMGNAHEESVMKSTLKARFGVNERHPTTKEEELMFYELEQQRKSDLESERTSQKESETTQAVSYLRYTKKKPDACLISLIYSKLKGQEKLVRIVRIINSVFCHKQYETVSGKLEKKQQPQIVEQTKPEPIIMEEKKSQKQIVQVSIEPNHIQQPSKPIQEENPAQKRSMFAMSKEMLEEINFKIERRNDLTSNETPNTGEQRKNERST